MKDNNNNSSINITELNLSNYLIILLSSHNSFKYQFAILYKNYLLKKYNSEFKTSEINIINEIFSSIESLLQYGINLTYDKKYSITLEIIVTSKTHIAALAMLLFCVFADNIVKT